MNNAAAQPIRGMANGDDPDPTAVSGRASDAADDAEGELAGPIAGDGPGEGAAPAAHRRLVVVPRLPGPIRPLDVAPHRQGDDLDVLIDEVFGPPTDEGPGWFDAALIAGGLALVAWSVVAGGTGLGVLGVVLLVLGVALPARSLMRAGRARRIAGRERAAMSSGAALDVSDPAVGALVAAYESLRLAAGLPGAGTGPEAIEAGHAALLEVVSLLGPRPPVDDAERGYVDDRTAAIRDLTAALTRRQRSWRRRQRTPEADARQADERAAAIVRAREELEAATGSSSVAELDELRTRLDREDAGHDA